MKKNQMTIRGLLAALASLLLLSACSRDITPAATSRIHVSIGAGYGSEGTKSAVSEGQNEEGTITRSLLFTVGDRLWFNENINDDYMMGGTLTAVSVSEDGKSATFSGDLTVYKNTDDGWVEATDYDLGHPDDPMKVFRCAPEGYLIHREAPKGWYTTCVDRTYPDFEYAFGLCSDVNTLMSSVLVICGYYDYNDKCFKLEASRSILNCTISGLTANSEFYVKMETGYGGQSYNQAVTTDGEGTARFAITFEFSAGVEYMLQFSDSFDGDPDFEVDLGDLTLGAKVYNVTRTATAVQ